MRSFIRWIFYENKDLSVLIKNNENNENWPGVEEFVRITDIWWKIIDNQQKGINEFEIKNNKTRQIMAEVQSWFRNEYNLLGKPAKRAWLSKQNELRILERELQVHQYNLDHPKEKLEEHEKRCLLKKIEIGERKIGNCKDELEEITKAYENEKRELCQRLSYTKEDLEPFTEDPERKIDPLTRKLIIGRENYYQWWRKFVDIHPDSEQLDDLNDILNEWYEHNEGEGPEENPYEIYVEEKTDDSLIFVWKPVELEQETVNEEGEIVKVKGRYLALLRNFLFNYYGEWYEVSDYTQLNYNLIAVECQRSIFYNEYRHLNKCQANVIIHHAPRTIASQEICSCPSYEIYTSRNSFDLEYELRFDTYRVGKDELKSQNRIYDPDDRAFDIVVGGVPRKVNTNEEWGYIERELFTERRDPTRALAPEDNTPEIRVMTRAIAAVGSTIDSIGTGIKEFFTGKKSILYILLGQRLNGGTWTATYFFCPSSEEEAKNTPTIDGEKRNIYFKRVGDYDNARQLSSLTDETKEKFLEERGLLADPMHHFLRTHIKATIFWRKKPVWQGNYWDIHNKMMITESISPSGTAVTFEGSGRILGRVTELVTARVGLDTQGFLNVLVTTATTIASAAVPGAGAVGMAASVAMKAGMNLAGGMAQAATNELMSTPSYSEVTENMTIGEFRHKFQYGKTRPISLELEYNQELANQYLNKRELKGPMLYTYKNLENFGNLLVQQPTDKDGHFLKASVISWNLPTKNSEWWRTGITEGRFIYHTNHQSFYTKSLTVGKTATSRGGISRGNWNEFSFMKSCGVKGGFDNISDRGGGFYVYKHKNGRPNYIRPKGGGHDFLPDIMREMHRRHPGFIADNNLNRSDMWLVNWPEPEFNDERWDIPQNYRNSNLESGQPSCDIEYRLDFFSGGDESLPGERYNITHILVSKTNTGTRSDLNFNLVGEIVRKNRGGSPSGIPPSTNLPTDPNSVNIPSATPFNPNQFPSSGNLMSSPAGSGETEFNIPDLDNGPDPDWDQSLDTDISQDPDDDPTQDPDKPTDPEIPPDTPPDDDND